MPESYPEMKKLRNSAQARKRASKKSTLALKPKPDVSHQKSKNRGYIGDLAKRTYVLQKFILKNVEKKFSEILSEILLV